MAAKHKYLVMSSKDLPQLGWEQGLLETVGICHTLSRAYTIALWLGGITQPKINYRKCLSLMKSKGAVRIDSEKEHEACAVIVRTRIY